MFYICQCFVSVECSLPQVLEVRNKKYGDNAIECAETYMEYGRALLEQARSNTDVLGAQMRTAVNKHDINDDEKKEDNEKKKAEAQHSEAGEHATQHP